MGRAGLDYLSESTDGRIGKVGVFSSIGKVGWLGRIGRRGPLTTYS